MVLAMCGVSAVAGLAQEGAHGGKPASAEAGMASMGEMPLVAPLFIENGQLSTTVTIVSGMARATTVDVVLLDQKGAEIIRQTYPLDGHAQLVVKVADLLQAANSGIFVGSVKVETDAEAQMNMAVLGQVSIAGTARSAQVYMEEEFPMTAAGDSGVFRAVAPAGLGFPVLALRSTSSTYQTVTMTCLYEHGDPAQTQVKLAPGEMVLSGACAAGNERLPSLDAGWTQQKVDSKGATGISVTSTGAAGAFCVYGFLMAGQAGSPIYTALNFTDAGAMNSGNTVFAGVPVGAQNHMGSDVFAPALALVNFGTQAVKATVIHAVMSGDGPSGKPAATVTVPGQSSMTVPLASLNGDPQMRNSFVVQSDAAKGTLYASLTVFGGNTFRAVQLLGRDAWQPYNGGAHPWTTAGGATSTLLLFNYSSTPQTFYVWISGGGVQWRQRYELAALETKALDVGNLVATGAKDEVGQILPPDVTGGVAQWTTFSFGKGTGRLLVTQPGTGLARNFSCQQTADLCGTSSMDNSSLSFPVQTSGQMGPFWADCCMTTIGVCGGINNGPMGWGANWTSYNTSVASIPSSQNQTAVQINGVSAGSASIRADPLPETQTLPNGLPWSCYAASQNGSVSVWDATPTVTGISPPAPNGFVVGTFADFHLTGQHFGTNLAQVSFSLGDTITVLSNTDTSIHATFTPAHAGTGTFTVTATGYGGQGFLPGPGQSPHSPPSPQAKVSAPCPTSVTIASTTQLPLANDFPSYKSGFGILTMMSVGSRNHLQRNSSHRERHDVIEYLVLAAFNQAQTAAEIALGPLGHPVRQARARNADPANGKRSILGSACTRKLHRSLLGGTGVNSCVATCAQTYKSCGVTIGSFTITKTLTHGSLNGTAVTNVSVSKQ